ncbi:MAG: hypothetical protein ACW981_09605 [Candidatus Hodarchaeales archaeon]
MINSDSKVKKQKIHPIFSGESFYFILKITLLTQLFNAILTIIDIILNNKTNFDFFFLLSFLEAGIFLIAGPLIAFFEPYDPKKFEKPLENENIDIKIPKKNKKVKKIPPREKSSGSRAPDVSRAEVIYYGKITIFSGILILISSTFIDLFV